MSFVLIAYSNTTTTAAAATTSTFSPSRCANLSDSCPLPRACCGNWAVHWGRTHFWAAGPPPSHCPADARWPGWRGGWSSAPHRACPRRDPVRSRPCCRCAAIAAAPSWTCRSVPAVCPRWSQAGRSSTPAPHWRAQFARTRAVPWDCPCHRQPWTRKGREREGPTDGRLSCEGLERG